LLGRSISPAQATADTTKNPKIIGTSNTPGLWEKVSDTSKLFAGEPEQV
jgi:hypothetical protein